MMISSEGYNHNWMMKGNQSRFECMAGVVSPE